MSCTPSTSWACERKSHDMWRGATALSPKSAPISWVGLSTRMLLPLRGAWGVAYRGHDAAVVVYWGQLIQNGLHPMWLQPSQIQARGQVGQESNLQPAVLEIQSGVSGGVGHHRHLPICPTGSVVSCRRAFLGVTASNHPVLFRSIRLVCWQFSGMWFIFTVVLSE
jgi:hypothetical protein